MLYCLAVEEDSVNRPSGGVEWRRLGRTMWASEERTAPFSFSPIEDRTFRDAPHLSRNVTRIRRLQTANGLPFT
jgi:hypothetical protein